MYKILIALLLSALTLNAQQLPSKVEIISTMKRVNDYWISQNTTPGNNQWARAAYFTGHVDFYKIYPKQSYYQYADIWATNNNWALNGGNTTRNADNQTCGQIYIDLYNIDETQPSFKIANIKTNIDNMVVSSKIDDWWWIDALYMTMPVFARLGLQYSDDVYTSKMYQLYTHCKVNRGLYNSTVGLWYRDETFKPPYKTLGGKDSYWSRGNGWVFAAHARTLQLLPEGDPYRNEYIQTFQKMALALKERQRTDGFWNVSLDDPNDYGGPETSGTSFFVYGMAWGINNGLLNREEYYPVIAKAWQGLTTMAVQPSGFLGYIQGVGTNPNSSQPVTVASNADFGVGAFLLAGTELAKMADGDMPVPSAFGLQSATVQNPNVLLLTFNLAVNADNAFNINNYSISNGVEVIAATAGPQSNTVLLEMSGLSFGRYMVTASNLTSITNIPLEIGESAQFSYSGIVSVTASDYEANTSNTPDKTIDFDLSTRWSSMGDGQWILYDLGQQKTVKSVELAFYKGNERLAYFAIQLSVNGTDFTEVFNGASSGNTINLETFHFNHQNARYVRIIGKGNSASQWNSITETRINADVITNISTTAHKNHPLKLVPNPYYGGKLKINIDGNDNMIMKVSIVNLLGKQMLHGNYQCINGEISLHNLDLKSGFYIVSVSDNALTSTAVLCVK